MNYKILSVFVIILTLLTTSYGCVYMEDHSSCDFVTNQGSNIISVDTSSLGEYKEISARITLLNGETLHLEYLDSESTSSQATFFQSRMLEEFGVYNLQIRATLQDGVSQVTRDFTLLYDNSKPLPPVVQRIGPSPTNPNILSIEGFVNYQALGGEIIAFSNGREETRALVSQEGSFIINIPKSSVNRIELVHRVNSQGSFIDSSTFKTIYYSSQIRDVIFSTTDVARVDSINFISDNPLTYQSPSKITTFTPHYHISGRASQGNVVFIQGVPVPVIDGEFQTYILLNEGEENLCVVGENIQCRLFNTIYSHANPQTLFSLANKERLLGIDLDNLEDSTLVSKLLVQGSDSRFVDVSPQVSIVDRNLFLIEAMYPGLYERQYVLVDNEDPQIEILSSNHLFRDSKIGILVRDDTRIDLSSFNLLIQEHSLSSSDANVAITQNGVSYLEFSVPPISSNSPTTIISSIRDVEGNTATTQKVVSSIQSTTSSPKLDIELVSSGKLIGNRIYINSDINSITLKIRNINSLNENTPITTNLLKLNDELINSFSINSNNELIVEVDVSQISQLAELDLGLNLFSSSSALTPSSQPQLTFEIYPIGRVLESSRTHRVIASHVGEDNEIVVKLLSNYVDYSSLRASNGATFRVNGNYMFINLRSATTSNINFRDLSGASYTFQVGVDRNQNVRIQNIPNTLLYNTFRIHSQKTSHFVDLLFSSRHAQSLSSIIANSEVHTNIPYLEGLSRSLISFYDSSRRNTVISNSPLQQTFSFNSYPTMQIPTSQSGVGELFYRGKLQYVPEDQSQVIVQGRVIGNEDIAMMYINGVQCLFEERFFMCELDRNNYVGTELSPKFYDNLGNEVVIAYNLLFLRSPRGILNLGTLTNVEIGLEGVFISNRGQGEIIQEDVTNLISCQGSNVEGYTYNLNSNGILSLSKTSTGPVGVTINCELEYRNLFKSSTISGFFTEEDTDGGEEPIENSLFTKFPQNTLNVGTSLSTTVFIGATSDSGTDITNNILCFSSSQNIEISPQSDQNLNVDGKLQIQRISNESFSSSISCSVQDGVREETRSFQIIFDKISNTPIIETPRSIQLGIDALKSNLITTSEPYAFSQGDLVFTIEPEVIGTYRLFMNGELVKTVQYPNIEITLTQEDYLNLGLSGEFEVQARDDLGSSNTIRMRFVRVLGAIVSIIVS